MCTGEAEKEMDPIPQQAKMWTPRFAAKRGFIHKVAEQGDGRTSLRSTSEKVKALGYLWDKDVRWSEA